MIAEHYLISKLFPATQSHTTLRISGKEKQNERRT